METEEIRIKKEILDKIEEEIYNRLDKWVDIICDHLIDPISDFIFSIYANKKSGEVYVRYGYGQIGIPTVFLDDDDIFWYCDCKFSAIDDRIDSFYVYVIYNEDGTADDEIRLLADIVFNNGITEEIEEDAEEYDYEDAYKYLDEFKKIKDYSKLELEDAIKLIENDELRNKLKEQYKNVDDGYSNFIKESKSYIKDNMFDPDRCSMIDMIVI